MADTQRSAITPQVAAHVLWHYGEGGLRSGSFVRNLLGTVVTADSVNAGLLRQVYPGYVAAVELAEHHEDGIEQLQRIAGATATPVRAASSSPSRAWLRSGRRTVSVPLLPPVVRTRRAAA